MLCRFITYPAIAGFDENATCWHDHSRVAGGGRPLIDALTQYAFEKSDLCRVFALPLAENPGSTRVLEKAGYQLEGRLRKAVIKEARILDQLLFAAIRE